MADERLDFRELAALLNHSRTTEIELEPLRRERGWSLYRGYYRVHIERIPFHILYLHSGASTADLQQAHGDAFVEGVTHVVYPPSLGDRNRSLARLFEKKAKGFWTTKAYLFSFLDRELREYTDRLSEQEPAFFIYPPVETPSGFERRQPSPLMDVLRSTASRDGDIGTVAIVLAEPGQGKTYLSRYLVSQVSRNFPSLVPIMVDATQWQNQGSDDLASLWKTILHSFEHYNSPIAWLDGNEEGFLRATLKAEIFRIVFDGFDEYILRNRGHVTALEVLETLAELARSTGARIVVTSRTSFWNTIAGTEDLARLKSTSGNIDVYKILPFDPQHARTYFKRRLNDDQPRIDRAIGLFHTMRRQNEEYAGRGFVLSLIADLVDDDSPVAHIGVVQDVARWLLDALCQRETLRQQLPLSASEQLRVFRAFAAEVAVGEDPSSELLHLVIEEQRPDLDLSARVFLLAKLAEHPIIARSSVKDKWEFRQKQTEVVLIADAIENSGSKLSHLVARLRLDPGSRQDVASAIVNSALSLTDDRALLQLQSIIGAMAGVEGGASPGSHSGDGPRLGAHVALLYLDRGMKSANHAERADFLLRLAGSPVTGLTFSGTVSRLDLSGVTFANCRFEGVTWANCEFDSKTTFQRCYLVGGAPPQHCRAFGSVQFVECKFDLEASAWIDMVQVNEGRRAYSLEDLRSDIYSIVNKFVVKGGLNMKEVKERNLARGNVSGSRHRDQVVSRLSEHVIERHAAGEAEPVYSVRSGAREAVRYYASNNVFTGPLRIAYDELLQDLELDRRTPG